jgi:hypothetical protein
MVPRDLRFYTGDECGAVRLDPEVFARIPDCERITRSNYQLFASLACE